VSGKGCLYVGIILVLVALMCGLSSGFLSSLKVPTLLDSVIGVPTLPTVNLPAERIIGSVEILGFNTGLTNTLLATIIVDILLVALALVATRKISCGYSRRLGTARSAKHFRVDHRDVVWPG